MLLSNRTQFNISEAWNDALRRSGKWRHFATASEKNCVQASGAFCFAKKIMDFYQSLGSDSPADLSLIIMFIGTIIFLIWLDYEINKQK